MEPLWSPVVATRGNQPQIGRPSKPQKQAKSVATGCHRLPQEIHGKEGVDGSSPSEGSAKVPHNGAFCKRSVTRWTSVSLVRSPFWSLQGADAVRDCSGEGGGGVAACFGGEGVAEVGVERAPLQPAGLIDGQEAFDRALAAFGL